MDIIQKGGGGGLYEYIHQLRHRECIYMFSKVSLLCSNIFMQLEVILTGNTFPVIGALMYIHACCETLKSCILNTYVCTLQDDILP